MLSLKKTSKTTDKIAVIKIKFKQCIYFAVLQNIVTLLANRELFNLHDNLNLSYAVFR